MGTKSPRSFHVCACPEALEADPGRLQLFAECGVTDVWVGGFFYGHWPRSPEQIQEWLKRVEKAGMAAHVVNIPLGHPGDSLGSTANDFPLTPPNQWRLAVRPDGSKYAGTSLHAPATEQNIEALRRLRSLGVKRVFLDDDFRLATGPGVIGGCFCEEHRRDFLQSHGYDGGKWEELLASVRTRSLTPVLRAWVEFTCDQLTACFRAQQAAVPEIQLGIMVMYFGSEKAGIRLADYNGAPLRVGELMFDDASFGPIKNKTAELFSCLFHRRYVQPALAFSETTAYPADKLSAKNMAAKLAVSTIADVRNSMFMSGVSPFPRELWQILAPAMKKHAAIHAQIAGHTPRGPFKHFWGESSRYVGNDDPYSLFLALGVPFEVTERPASDGWTFLADADARTAVASKAPASGGTTLVVRPAAGVSLPSGRVIEENLEALFALKREIAPRLHSIPYVEEEKPVVCAWYPTASSVLLWNLSEQREKLTLRIGETHRTMDVDGLDVALLSEMPTA